VIVNLALHVKLGLMRGFYGFPQPGRSVNWVVSWKR